MSRPNEEPELPQQSKQICISTALLSKDVATPFWYLEVHRLGTRST